MLIVDISHMYRQCLIQACFFLIFSDAPLGEESVMLWEI